MIFVRTRLFGHTVAWALLSAWAASAQAQTLSSPVPPAAIKGNAGAATAPDIPMGQGAGVHGANSPFPALVARSDVVPWSVLTDIKTQNVKNRILPVFNMGQMQLNQKTQRVQGFMMPLDPGEKQNRFLLSSVPLTCSFCLPGGPESMVEVRTKTPVRYSIEPITVEGKFLVLNDDSLGLYYRMTDATSVK
jgi:hypothetical protein